MKKKKIKRKKETTTALGLDTLYPDVKNFVLSQQQVSISRVQRQFGIGYNRSAQLINSLEKNNIIGPINGSKPREVLIKKTS